jgi:predicted dehydrogenase
MTNPIQTGVLSYGMSGRIFQAPFLHAHPGFTLRAVTERSKKQVQQRYPDVISYDSVEELLADPEIELVAVNTPSNTHVELARQALQAGKHVLIEKPVATTSAEVQELWDLARQQGKQIFAYQNRRWDSDFQSVKQIVESGQLGQLIEVTFRFDRYKVTLNPKPFKETPLPGSGLLYDLGPHILDQALSLFGKPEQVRKTQGRFRPDSQVDDYFQLQLYYPNGPLVTVASGLLIAEPLPSYTLHGTQGSYLKPRADVQEAQLDQEVLPTAPEYGQEHTELAGKLTLADAAGNKTTTTVPAPKGDYLQLFEAVYQALRNNVAYPITEQHILWQLQILEQTPGTWVLNS